MTPSKSSLGSTALLLVAALALSTGCAASRRETYLQEKAGTHVYRQPIAEVWPKAKEVLTEEGFSLMEAKGGFEMQTDWTMQGAALLAGHLVRALPGARHREGPGPVLGGVPQAEPRPSPRAPTTPARAAPRPSRRTPARSPATTRWSGSSSRRRTPRPPRPWRPRPPRRCSSRAQSRSGTSTVSPSMGHLHLPLVLLARLHEQLRGVGVMPAGQVREDEPPHARLARHPRRLARRGVPRLQRPLLLVIAEGGLVDEQVRVLRRPRQRGARPRVSGDDQPPAVARRAQHVLGLHQGAVRQRHRSPFCSFPKSGPAGTPERLAPSPG